MAFSNGTNLFPHKGRCPSAKGQVSVKNKLRKILLFAVLSAGSLMGVPMEPNQIEELLGLMNQPTLEVVLPEENDEDSK
jgi:hypothetical protein